MVRRDGKTWELTVCVLLTVAFCQISPGGYFGLEVKAELPALPDGIVEAGNIELRGDRAICDVNIPGLIRSESKWELTYWNRDAGRRISTLDVEGAKQVAAAFLDKHFPGILHNREYVGHGVTTTSQFKDAQGNMAIMGYSVSFRLAYRSVRVLNDRIGVTIEGDDVKGADLKVYCVKETGPRERLLSASECLAKVVETLKSDFEGLPQQIVVEDVRFGYEGGFVQPWEESRANWAEPFIAIPVYKIIAGPAGALSASRIYTFDARTAELIHPKRAEGRVEVEIPGPKLRFTEDRSYELFIVGPRNVKIESVVFDMQSVPVRGCHLTYSVREVFDNLNSWRFADSSSLLWPRLELDYREGPNSIATGVLNVETPGEYEVEMLVYQCRDRRHPTGQTVVVGIDETSYELADDGPVGYRIWEKWGSTRLSAGQHTIEVRRGSGEAGNCEVGPIRLRPTGGDGSIITRVKDLKLWFRQGISPDYYGCSPSTERFTTDDIRHKFTSVFSNTVSGGLRNRAVGSFSVSSTGAGKLRIHSLNIVLSAGEQDQVEDKARQFLLIYPDGGASREVSSEELDVLTTYLKNTIETRRELWMQERLELCELGKRVAAGCEGGVAKDMWGEFQDLYLELANREARTLANSFSKTRGAPPRSPEFINWGEMTSIWWGKMAFDTKRITSEGRYLDPWGNVYVLQYVEQDKRIIVRSWGPNGRDDKGEGDDIVTEGNISLMWDG